MGLRLRTYMEAVLNIGDARVQLHDLFLTLFVSLGQYMMTRGCE